MFICRKQHTSMSEHLIGTNQRAHIATEFSSAFHVVHLLITEVLLRAAAWVCMRKKFFGVCIESEEFEEKKWIPEQPQGSFAASLSPKEVMYESICN